MPEEIQERAQFGGVMRGARYEDADERTTLFLFLALPSSSSRSATGST